MKLPKYKIGESLFCLEKSAFQNVTITNIGYYKDRDLHFYICKSDKWDNIEIYETTLDTSWISIQTRSDKFKQLLECQNQ